MNQKQEESEDKPRNGPLSDIRVVEMGQLLAGPFCGQLLADFGAEVIKCEPPGVGDPMRQWGREKPYGKSLWWPVVARNKKSLTINLRTAEGQAIIHDLVKSCDILIENFRPGTMERWNLSYDRLKEINPKLIMVRVTGFGQTGPYVTCRLRSIGEAMGGLRYVVGDPSTQPSRMGISIGDELAATYACLGAMMALHARERTGVGQIVDSAIYEAVLAMMESMVTEYSVAGYIRERTGPILPNVSPSNIFNTKDGKLLLIGANQDTVFARLAEAMDRPDLATDPRYATHAARGEHQAELDGLIDDWTKTIALDPLQKKLNDAGVPCGLIYTAPDMLEDPHFKARNAIVDVEHPDFGTIKMQNVAPRLSDTPGAVRHVGPELGQHTDEVLADILGYAEDQIIAWRDAGIV